MLKPLLLATAILAVAPVVYAAPPVETKSIPAEKLFPFLSNYYTLPAAQRAHFHLDYRLHTRGAAVSLVLNAKGAKIPLQPAADGALRPLPSAEQLKGTITISAPKDSRIGIAMDAVPSADVAPAMDASSLNLAVTECSAATKKLAGLLAMMVPVFDRVTVFGVSSAQVRLADGSLKPLPLIPATTDKTGNTTPAHFSYTPVDWPTAKTLVFNATPSRLAIDTKG